MVIFTVSYFIGTLWYIFTKQLYTKTNTGADSSSFFGYYDFNEKSASHNFDR